MSSKLLCYGARPDGHFNAILSILSPAYELHILDDRAQPNTSIKSNLVLGGLSYKITDPSMYDGFVVAVGDNHFRELCHLKGLANTVSPFSIIHPSAVISDSAIISPGSFIGPNVTIGASVFIGKSTIINSNTVVEHDSYIADFCHIAPGCSIAGRVQIGKYTFIGIGSCIIPDITIGDSCIVGAGSTIVDLLPDNVVAYGFKAKPKRHNDLNIYTKNV